MKDRIPTKPGRVQLVPVTGQTNIYDMTMADEPTEAGTPLNKANLMSDAAAAAVWPVAADRPSDPTPSAAFEVLGKRGGKILAVYTTTQSSGTEQFNLSEPIENFQKLEVWACQGLDSGATHSAFAIYSGNYSYSAPTVASAKTLGTVASGTHTLTVFQDLFLQNDSTNGSKYLCSSGGGPTFSGFNTYNERGYMSGTLISMDKFSGSSGICPDVKIVIIGYSY